MPKSTLFICKSCHHSSEKRPADQPAAGQVLLDQIIPLATENLPSDTVDILFVMVDRDEDRKAFEKVMQKPLGQKLKAIQQERVYFVDGLIWLGPSLTAADIVLDDLEKYLVNTS